MTSEEIDESNPWTTTSSRPVYENPWISVREDQVIRPDGSPGIYGVVHFQNKAIGVLPVEEDGRIWLVGQHRYPLDLFSWEIPEGGGPMDESSEATALRELREETGLTAAIIEPLGGPIHISNSVSDEVGFLFRASGLTQGPSEPEGTERLHVKCVSWDEAWAMLERGEITDSLTAIALLREANRRSRQLAARSLQFSWLSGRFAIVRMEPKSPIPAWACAGAFVSVTRTEDELSIVCDANVVPGNVAANSDWCMLKLQGPMELNVVGVMAAITKPIAEAGIPLFAISTFDTDYLLVKASEAGRVEAVLEKAGHDVRAMQA